MKCLNCGAEIPAQAAFCPSCGAKAVSPADLCSQCGKTLLPGAQFCNNCGAPAGAAAKAAKPTAAACPQCGAPVKPGILFCPNCGRKLLESAPLPPVQTAYAPPAYVPPAVAQPVYQQPYALPQNQPYAAQPMSQPYGQPVPPKKRGAGLKVLIALLVVAVVVAGAYLLFGRQLKRLVMGNKAVYMEIEGKALRQDSADMVSNLAEWKNDEVLPAKGGSNVSLSLDLAEGITGIDPTLASALENMTIRSKIMFDRKADTPKVFGSVGLLTGEEELLTVEGFYSDEQLVVGLPGILAKYVTASKDELIELVGGTGVTIDTTQASGALGALTQMFTDGIDFDDQALQSSINKMIDIMLKHIDKVEFAAGQTLAAGGVEAEYDLYTMTVSKASASAMVVEICEYLKDDQEIFDLAGQVYAMAAASGSLAEPELTLDAYQEALDNVIADVEDSEDTSGDFTMVQKVWVGKNDEVFGRELTVTDENEETQLHLLIANPVDGQEEGIELSLEASGESYRIVGSYTVDQNLKTGKITVLSGTDTVAEIAIQDLDTDSPDNVEWLIGEVSITIINAGEEYTGPTSFTYKGWMDGEQKLLRLGIPEYGSLELGYAEIPESEVSFPSYDPSQLVNVNDEAGLESLMNEEAMNKLNDIVSRLGLLPSDVE